jgi:hypothetical protein
MSTADVAITVQPKRAGKASRKGKGRSQNNQDKVKVKAAGQAKAIVRTALPAVSGNPKLRSRIVNPYLACLLDPESFPPHCYPDRHGENSAVSRFVNNIPMTLAADGSFYVRADPTLKQTVTYSLPSTASTSNWAAGAQYPPSGVAVPNSAREPARIPATMTTPADPPGFIYTGNTGQAKLRQVGAVTYLTPRSGNATLTCAALTTWSGTNLNTVTEWQVLPDNAAAIPNIAGAVTIPNTVNSFQIQIKTPSGVEFLKDYQFTLVTPMSVSTNLSNTYLGQSDIPDFSTLVSSEGGGSQMCESYRVVAQSLLLTFQGDTLTDGGQLAAVRTAGGQDPDDEGWIDYTSISSLSNVNLNTFEGPLKYGAYGIWQGTSDNDYDYRNPAVVNDGQLPCLVVAGKSTSSSTTVRARVVTVVEWKSNKAFISTRPSVIDSDMLETAHRALQAFPAWHENPTHKKDIAKFFNDVLDFGSALYDRGNKFIGDAVNRIPGALGFIDKLVPGLGPLAGLLPMLL